MKFSYPLLKAFIPAVRSKSACIEALTLHAFEAEDADGNTVDISVAPNRYADAASHWGIARELAAILDTKARIQSHRLVNLPQRKTMRIDVRNANACPRYIAYRFSIGKHAATPKEIKDVLIACGLRPINLIVDITNYVMLETGQPLHAFDARMISNQALIIRNAHAGEEITSIDGKQYKLHKDDLVIADAKRPLAIAGIKGGRGSEITNATKEIILEAANFDPVGVYRTSQRLNLKTDASVRFGHGLSPELAGVGADRAAELLVSFAGAKLLDTADMYPKRQGKTVLAFDLDRHAALMGSMPTASAAAAILKRLGFGVKPTGKMKLRVEVPPLRLDIERQEDISEEIARIQGYGTIVPQPPVLAIKPADTSEELEDETKLRRILSSLGYDEIYTHSFVPRSQEKQAFADARSIGFQHTEGLVEPVNPTSEQFWYLRPSLLATMRTAVEEAAERTLPIRAFEIGTVFAKTAVVLTEDRRLGIALHSADAGNVIELKGVCEELLKQIGIADFFFREENGFLRIESDHTVVGTILTIKKPRHAFAYAELRVGAVSRLAEEEREYEPLSRFPSIMRDISFIVDANTRIGPIVQAVQDSDVHDIADVDLLDLYQDESIGDGRKSITLRIVFQADDRTLTDAEADAETAKITKLLEEQFSAEMR